MRRLLPKLLVFVAVDVSLVVNREELVGVDGDQDGTGEGLRGGGGGEGRGGEGGGERIYVWRLESC